ncbi:uncharacterized protein LOC108042385 [Drosophila rhopaloa]|uniref:Uncharacterized protein LOC108042385 n=1 Tax=Drosophila rhopaloa TaxID=1041015 RepID=A0A6P4EHT3_DRORH|nr:uncharacterized protein LOC108042385 [Drosophila rhopaloa]
MRSLRRGFAAAAVGDFRKISPKLGQSSNPLFSWCPPAPPPSTNFVKSLGSNNWNYLRLIEDPELPKLVKLYEQVCRCSRKGHLGSTSLKRSELDNPPRKLWEKSTFHKYTKGSKRSLEKKNIATNESNSSQKDSGSKNTEFSCRHPKKHIRFDMNNPPKKSRPKSKIPKQTKDKKNLKKPKTLRSRKSLGNNLFKDLKKDKLGDFIFFKEGPGIQFTKDYVIGDNFGTGEEDLSANEDASPHDSGPLMEMTSTWSGPSNSSWLPRIVSKYVNPVDLFHFAPINLKAHKDHFVSLHSKKPNAFKRRWSTVPWPQSSELSKRSISGVNLQSPIKKEHNVAKKLLKEKAATLSIKGFKYHSFRVNFWPKKRRRSGKTVSRPSKVVRNRCELCDFCRPSSQPDEPFMIEMKKRRDREELQRYYLKMEERNQESRAAKEYSKQSSKPQGHRTFSDSKPLGLNVNCSSNLRKMRHQLEQCLTILNLCRLLVEVRLRLSRTQTESKGCRGGFCAGPEPN